MCNGHHRVSEISTEVETPCIVFDEVQLRTSMEVIRKATSCTPVELLYSMKACSTTFVLKVIAEGVSGFSCSSVYEARLAREVLRETASVHITTPALALADVEQLATVCDFVSYNSLRQAERSRQLLGDGTGRGLRVNPQLSLLMTKGMTHAAAPQNSGSRLSTWSGSSGRTPPYSKISTASTYTRIATRTVSRISPVR